MDEIRIYHNPRCSKSRQTLALLEEHGIEPTIIEYLHTPPSAKELKELLQLLEMKPRELLRHSEPLYKELALDNAKLTDAQIIKIMTTNPILIERPIVVVNKKAVIGRPPENVLDII